MEDCEVTRSQEPFINKPCVSSGVCEHDKNEVLDKIRAEIKVTIKGRKVEITEELHKLGYEYKTEFYDDGTICTHKFIRPDCMRDGCYWEVAIEDHTDDDGEDWLIFVRYHDPDEKDWFGKQRDISGCVEFEAMKLIVEFTEILKKGE